MAEIPRRPLGVNVMKYLVVGAGFSGATFARLKAEQGHSVRVIEQRDHVAGNAYDSQKMGEPMVHRYGPHLFHTNSERVYKFLSRFTEWYEYRHRVRARVLGRVVPLPFNFLSIELCFSGRRPDEIKTAMREVFKDNQRVTLRELKAQESPHLNKTLYDFVYENIFENYTQKMWGMDLEKLGPTVADRVPLIAGYDDSYFTDRFQCMPAWGYTQLVKSMLDHENIEVVTGMRWRENGREYDRMYFTGSIDDYFGHYLGHLEYRSMSFELKSLATGELRDEKGTATMNLPDHPKVTRYSDMAVITKFPGENTVVVVETPGPYVPGVNEPYYPIPTGEARAMYHRYEKLAEDTEVGMRVRFGGRLGSYQYLNMDQAVAQAMKAAEEF
jgi:UDP-galactopyranose mutase